MTALPVGGVPDGAYLLRDEPACSGPSPAAPACQPLLHYSSAWLLHYVHTVTLIVLLKLAFIVLSVPDQALVCILHHNHDMSRCDVFNVALASLQQSIRVALLGDSAHKHTEQMKVGPCKEAHHQCTPSSNSTSYVFHTF